MKIVFFLLSFLLISASCERKDKPWYSELYSHDLEDSFARNLQDERKDKSMSLTNGWILTPQSNYVTIENYIISLEEQLKGCQEGVKLTTQKSTSQ